jgi:hypothetical protein
LASGRSPDSRIVEFEIPSRAIRKTQPLWGVNPVVLLLELSRLQLRGSAGFTPASRTPDEKVIEEGKEKSKQNLDGCLSCFELCRVALKHKCDPLLLHAQQDFHQV